MKQFLRCFLISFVALFGSLNVWGYDFQVDGRSYTVISTKDKTCELSLGGDNTEEIIPSEVAFGDDTYKVISIGDFAYKNSNIWTVSIPDNIEHIGIMAFASCWKLIEVIWGQGVKRVEKNAFEDTYIKYLHINDLTSWCNIEFANEKPFPRFNVYVSLLSR